METFSYLRQMFTILLILTHRFACSCICSICSRAVGLLHLNKHYLILSYLILSYLILSYLILSYLILSYLILSYLILSYLIIFAHIFQKLCFICSRFSFAHRNVYHLRTVLVLHLRAFLHLFRGELIQGTMNKISALSLLPLR